MTTDTSSRRGALAAAASPAAPLAAPLTGVGVAHAQPAYPARPVRTVVPFAAGSSPDVIARLLAGRITRAVPQPVVVENRAGAATIVGTRHGGPPPAVGTAFSTPCTTPSA